MNYLNFVELLDILNFMRTLLKLHILVLVILFGLNLTGCLDQPSSGTESGTNLFTQPSQSPSFDPLRTICDPFKTNSQQARDRGLIGNLVYLTNDQPRYTKVEDYLSFGVLAPATIYLDRLYTPPRPFDLGFQTQNGDTVKTINGDTLYQYFGIQMKSQLQLAANEPAGYYQLALIADTGGKLKTTDADGVEKVLIDSFNKKSEHEEKEESKDSHDDGKMSEHDDDDENEAKVICATEPVYLDQNTKLPLTVEYFQGNSRHISLMAMWRPWPVASNKHSHSESEHSAGEKHDEDSDKNDHDDDSEEENFCGKSVKKLFKYSSTLPATPKTKFYEMLASKWKVLENENYYFPSQDLNPCVPVEQPLAITSFSISALTRNSITLTWTTNIPATSQGESINTLSGVTAQTSIDSALSTNHTLTITGLAPFTLYGVRAISGTPGGQSSISDIRAFRTPR